MCGAGSPPCWLFGLRQPNTGNYLGSLVGLMTDSGRAHAKEYFPELLLSVSLPHGEPQPPPASAADPPTLAGTSGSVSMGSPLLPLGPDVHPTLCVPSKSGVSASPSPVEVLQSNPLGFKVWCSRNSSSHCRTPRWGSLMWGSEPSLQWVDFCSISVLQCESLTQQLWDLILLWLRPSYHLIVASPLSLDVGYLFWWVPVSSCWWLSSS